MLYTEKKVRKLVMRLRDEYDQIVRKQRAAAEALKVENRDLRARVLELEGERQDVSSALVHAVAAGERIKTESAISADNERKELLLLAEKCRLLLEKLTAKYPDEEDCADFAAFTEALRQQLGEEEYEPAFDMDAVLSPKEPLDLGKLCRDLGLMEDEE